MKKLFFGLFATLTATTSFAQETVDKKVNFSVGVELASPVGDFNKTHNFGFGGTAQVEYMAAPQVGLTLNSGYITYSGKDIGIANAKYPNYGQIPILAGARYYFIKDIYVSGQLGLSIFKASGGGNSESGFSYAPGIGIKVSIIDMTLKYLGTSINNGSLNNTSLRVAVSF